MMGTGIALTDAVCAFLTVVLLGSVRCIRWVVLSSMAQNAEELASSR